MVVSKYIAAYLIVFASCLTTFIILFSLENEHQMIEPLIFKKASSLHPNSIKLFNLNFKYLINNNVCQNNFDITAVIIVTSYYGNIERRSAIRDSFSIEKLEKMKIKRVFLLAMGPQNNKYDVSYKAILNENERFGDLIQGNFIEAYRNLTYKHIMGLQWASSYCRNAKYVIKMDDDIVINMHKLLNVIDGLKTLNRNDLLAGNIFRGMVPVREPASKWYVTKQEYRNSMYPPYVSGWFYITTPKVAGKFAELSRETPYFWIDDVYVTGILSRKLKINHHKLNNIFAVHSEYLQCCIQDTKQHNYECDLIVGPNDGDNNLFYTFNEIMSKCVPHKCVKRPIDRNINETCVAERKVLIEKGKALIENVRLF